MYCPNCGTANTGDVKFCRSCGANLSLVPDALTGNLEPASGKQGSCKTKGRPDIAKGITEAFLGLGFLVLAAVLLISGQNWGVWMLIPGFALMGRGVAQMVTSRRAETKIPSTRLSALPRVTGDLPAHLPGVTEETTRRLELEPPRGQETGRIDA